MVVSNVNSILPTFTESFIQIKKGAKVPKARNAVLIIGLPGIGLVGKLAVDQLVKVKNAKRFATLYSPHFPNQALALKSGRLKVFEVAFYHIKLGKKDAIVAKGDVQPLTVEGQYEVCAKILSFHKKLGGTEVLSMAGYAVNYRPQKPVIYSSASEKQIFEKITKLGTKRTQKIVPIVGMAGMVPALSKAFGLQGACLLVETPGNVVDAHASAALLDFISAYFGEKIETSHLHDKAKKADESLKKMAEEQRKAEIESKRSMNGEELRYIR
jgi:uncharacterized protein (TIGR00162 family)